MVVSTYHHNSGSNCGSISYNIHLKIIFVPNHYDSGNNCGGISCSIYLKIIFVPYHHRFGKNNSGIVTLNFKNVTAFFSMRFFLNRGCRNWDRNLKEKV